MREFNFEKLNGDQIKSIELDFEDVKIDKKGLPVLPKKSYNETVNFYKDGYLMESVRYDYSGKKKELSSRVLLSRFDSVVNQVQVFYYRNDKESLLRVHTAEVENGKIIKEDIRND